VWEPYKVNTLGKGRVFSTSTLEVLTTITSYQAHTEVVSHSPGGEIQQMFTLHLLRQGLM